MLRTTYVPGRGFTANSIIPRRFVSSHTAPYIAALKRTTVEQQEAFGLNDSFLESVLNADSGIGAAAAQTSPPLPDPNITTQSFTEHQKMLFDVMLTLRCVKDAAVARGMVDRARANEMSQCEENVHKFMQPRYLSGSSDDKVEEVTLFFVCVAYFALLADCGVCLLTLIGNISSTC